MTLHYRQAEHPKDLDALRALSWAHLQSANAQYYELSGQRFDIDAMLEASMAKAELFFPPKGRAFLAEDPAGDAVALACLRPIASGGGEIKRMFVEPGLRGQGVGRRLLELLLAAAQELGWPYLRLDTAPWMTEAQGLYASAGFAYIDAYPEAEISADLHDHWRYMELTFHETGSLP